MEDIKLYKRKFNNTLEPFKVMLVSLQDSLTQEEWIKFVERTRLSVINQPDQYLGNDLPDRETLQLIVKIIFDEFLEERLYAAKSVV